MPSREYLDKLLDAESKSAALVAEAQSEAARRLASVKETCEKEFHATYAQQASSLEEKIAVELDVIQSEYRVSLDRCRDDLARSKLDVAAFNDFCEGSLDGIL